MVGIRFGGWRDELLTFMQCLGVITPPYLSQMTFALKQDIFARKKRSPLSDFNFSPLDLFRLAECSASPTVLDWEKTLSEEEEK